MVSPSVGLPKTRVELADLVPPVRFSIHCPARSPDDALAKEGALGHRRLLHARAGRTTLPLRRLPRDVLALPLLPQPGLSQMPRQPNPRVAQ